MESDDLCDGVDVPLMPAAVDFLAWVSGDGEVVGFFVSVFGKKKRYLDLLLLGDEQESMIDRYLECGEMFAFFLKESSDPVCVAVVTDEGDGVCELKNIAVNTDFQRRGYGRNMIDFLCGYYGGVYRAMLVGTGDSVSTVSFYESCGFLYSHTIANFFTDNYDHEIVEDGKPLKDMVCFVRGLSSK